MINITHGYLVHVFQSNSINEYYTSYIRTCHVDHFGYYALIQLFKTTGHHFDYDSLIIKSLKKQQNKRRQVKRRQVK
ncbi:hypothetical protein PP707_02955 [Acetobacter pasteurianus]|nr:hypothetical protein [Acetobacter pasteurianus]